MPVVKSANGCIRRKPAKETNMHQETFELAVRVGEWHERKVENILNVMEGVIADADEH